MRVNPPGLAFDVGRGSLRLAGARDLFVTHGHLDHSLGVPYVLSQRSLHRSQDTRVFCPAEAVDDLRDLVEAAARLEGAVYDYHLAGLDPGDRVAVGKGLTVEAFRTDHVVPSLGFRLWRAKRHLRPELRGLPGTELAARRERGEEITEVVEDLALSYCGDTGPGVFETDPRILGSRVLVIECTFLGEELRTKGSRYKHLHLEDLADRAADLRNEALVLIHLSRRHRASDLKREVERRMPDLADRVHLLIGRGEE